MAPCPNLVSRRLILDFFRELTGTSSQLCLLGRYHTVQSPLLVFAHPIVLAGLSDWHQGCIDSVVTVSTSSSYCFTDPRTILLDSPCLGGGERIVNGNDWGGARDCCVAIATAKKRWMQLNGTKHETLERKGMHMAGGKRPDKTHRSRQRSIDVCAEKRWEIRRSCCNKIVVNVCMALAVSRSCY